MTDNQRQISRGIITVNRRGLEQVFWLALSLFTLYLFWPFILGSLYGSRFGYISRDIPPHVLVIESILSASKWISIPLLILLFPVLFKLIFSMYPFEFFNTILNKKANRRNQLSGIDAKESEPHILEEQSISTRSQSLSVEGYLSSLIKDSKSLSERIYTRSGAYLLVGCLIAFSGLLFFYLQSAVLVGEKNISTLMTSLVPRFGILFFIELVAFFFLKQYRITMDEFKYYEAIKRHREANLAIFLLAEMKKDDLSQFRTVIETLSFFKSPDKLSKDETSELLESRKLSNEEISIFQNIIEVIGQKSKNASP